MGGIVATGFGGGHRACPKGARIAWVLALAHTGQVSPFVCTMTIADRDKGSSTNGRIQQVWTVFVLVAALAAAGMIWPTSPVKATLVAAWIAFNHVLVLGLEFLWLPGLMAKDPVAKPGALALLRAWMAESWHCWRVFAWRQPFRWRAYPDRLDGPGVQGRRGVVLLHGFYCNRGFWSSWLARLIADQRAFVAVNLEPPFSSIDRYVSQVEEAMARVQAATGLPPLLVGHSMGGLAARAWLAHLAESGTPPAERIDRLVTIGSPHAGTWTARFSHARNGRQMRIGSEWLQQLGQAWREGRAGITPDRVVCWYSNCDNIVIPPSTAILPGADNRHLHGAGHVDLAFRPEVMAQTLALLDGRT